MGPCQRSTAGTSGSGDLGEAQVSPRPGSRSDGSIAVLSRGDRGYFFCKVGLGVSLLRIPGLRFNGLQRLVTHPETGSQTITRPNCTINHLLSMQESYVRVTRREVSFLLLVLISSAKIH